MPIAIVTGATGINGRAIVKALSADPTTWKSIYAVSRRLNDKYPSQVKHLALDLLKGTEAVSEQLKSSISASNEPIYIFFTAYLATSSDQEDWDTNGSLIRNFLAGLRQSGLEKQVKRVVLTTGAKYYGVHLGAVPLPMVETDPRVDGEDRSPNFYYNQENILMDMSKQSKQATGGNGWDWVVAMPNDIIGFAKGNFMNAATTVALYATVCKEIGQELYFPGSEAFYNGWDCHSYAPLIAQFEIWAALKPECGNQYFNATNGEPSTWQRNWPKLAKRFGVTLPSEQFSKPLPFSTSQPLDPNPPAKSKLADFGLKGSKIAERKLAKQGTLENQVSLVKWAEQKEVKAAWEKIAEREGLQKDAFEHATWGFLDFMIGRSFELVISMNKARKLGWTGFIDDWEAYENIFDELESEKIIPKTS